VSELSGTAYVVLTNEAMQKRGNLGNSALDVVFGFRIRPDFTRAA
jgi:hypothetical protein